MSINRRIVTGMGAAAAASVFAPRVVRAQARFAGQEVKVLAVRASQFSAQEKRAAAFAEQTGAMVTFV